MNKKSLEFRFLPFCFVNSIALSSIKRSTTFSTMSRSYRASSAPLNYHTGGYISQGTKSWDTQGKDYLFNLFRKFTQDPSTGVSPLLNKDAQAVLALHTNDGFLNRYKRNRFCDNFKNVANNFLLKQQQSGRRRKDTGMFCTQFFILNLIYYH